MHAHGTDFLWSEDGVRKTQVLLNYDPYRRGLFPRELGVRFKLSLQYLDCFYENCSAMANSDSMNPLQKLTIGRLRDCQESTLNDF